MAARIARSRWLLIVLTMLPAAFGAALVQCGHAYSAADSPDAAEDALAEVGLADGGPSLWNGPALAFFAEGGAPPACPSDFAQRTELFDGLDASAPSCDGVCTCEAPTARCTGLTTRFFSDTKCETFCDQTSSDTCSNLSCGSSMQFLSGGIPSPAIIDCVPPGDAGPKGGQQTSIPMPGGPVSWARSVALCQGTSKSFPGAASGQEICIWHEGDAIDCPPDYPTHFTFSGSFADERSCDCQCQPQGGENAECTDASLSLYAVPACAPGAFETEVTGLGCITVPDRDAASFSTRAEPASLDASCLPVAHSSAQTSPSDPMTVCCSP